MVPLNKEKIQWLLNNINDTIKLLDKNRTINDELKSKFVTIKKIFNEIINQF